MEIKINDLVRLRKDLKQGKKYGKMNFVNKMDFKVNTMYKGMKVDREYALEELGL